MSVFVIVTDGPENEIVDIIRRDEVAIAPFGSRLFGPTPQGRLFPRMADITAAQQAIVLESINDSINTSPFLSDADRARLRTVFNSITPADRFQQVGRATAEQLGLIERAPVAFDQSPAVQSNIIARFIDP